MTHGVGFKGKVRHGTNSGYSQHGKDGTKPCAGCRAARTIYIRAHRQASPTYAANERKMNAAGHRARVRLARAHPKEYRRYYEQEMGR